MNRFKSELKTVQQFLVNFALMLIFWGTLLRNNFNADTLAHYTSIDADVYHNMQNGRYIKALLDEFLLTVELRTTDFLGLAVGLSLFIYALTMLILQMVFSKWEPEGSIKVKMGYYGMISLVFLNVLFAENLMFTESSIYFALAYLLSAFGVWLYTNDKPIKALVVVFLGTMLYQYAAVTSAIAIAIYIMLDENMILSKKSVIRELKGTVGFMFTGVLNLCVIKILDKLGIVDEFVTDTSDIDYLHRIRLVLEDIVKVNKSAAGLLPPVFLPLIVTIIAFVAIAIFLYKKKTIERLAYLILVYVGCYILLYSVPYVSIDFYVPGRMAFCFFMFQGMLAAVALVYSSEKSRVVLSHIFLGYLLIQCIFCGFLTSAKIASNRIDRINAAMLVDAISDYEAENGIQIENIGICKDEYAPDYYDGIGYQAHQINERVSTQAPISLIKYVTGRSFNKVEMDENIYAAYFEGKDWDVPDYDEQLVFVGNTVYWCQY